MGANAFRTLYRSNSDHEMLWSKWRDVMAEQPIDHERILRVSKLVKSLDLEDKLIALSILSNILTIYVQTGRNRSIAVEHQEHGGEPGYTVAINGPGLQIIIPRAALESELD
jgi:hypothetical protein